MLDLGSGETGFVEDGWIGRVLSVGEEVRLRVTESVARCVMTTLPQVDLPKDSGIMSTTYRHNDNNAGVYAKVLQGGKISRGDRVVLV